MAEPSGPRAGFWQRFGAALIDGILLGIVGAVIQVLIHSVGGLIVATVVT